MVKGREYRLSKGLCALNLNVDGRRWTFKAAVLVFDDKRTTSLPSVALTWPPTLHETPQSRDTVPSEFWIQPRIASVLRLGFFDEINCTCVSFRPDEFGVRQVE